MWLAFDIGTTGTKAALVNDTGQTIRTAYRGYETQVGEGGMVEQRAQDWWQAVIEAARELDAGEVEAIAITGQMQDVILLDSQNEPVRPVILYSDTRAHREAEIINEIIRPDALFALTGNFQDAGSLLAKLRWLAQHEASALQQTRLILLGAADFIGLELTGVAVSDATTASTTGLMDISSRTKIDTLVLERLGLSFVGPLLPPIKPGGAILGTLTAAAAEQLGLTAGIPVHHGPGDAGATTLGAGSGEEGPVYGYIGTSGWIAFTSARPLTLGGGVFITLAHPRSDHFIYIAPLLTAGGNLDWVRGLFSVDDPAILINEALSVPSGALLYLPYLNGERSPFSDPFARGAFIGLNARHERPDLVRAVLEGVVLAYRHALEALIGGSVTDLILTGGGTRSRAWCQLFADITQVPVRIADDASNVGARGAVLAAQVQTGNYSNYTPPGFSSFAGALQPDPAVQAHYQQKFELFKASYQGLKPIFGAMRQG